jgi:hypothetical protein
MIRKLKSDEYRLYSRKVDPKTRKRRNLGTFKSRAGRLRARARGAVFQAALARSSRSCRTNAEVTVARLSLSRRLLRSIEFRLKKRPAIERAFFSLYCDAVIIIY